MTSAWSPAGDRDLRVGLVGLGSMGRNHLRVLSSMPGTRLVAVADTDRAAVEAATSGTGAQGFTEPLALFAEADLDAVVIASPTTTHLTLAMAALERGVAALVEKPLAATPEDAATLVDAAQRSGVPLQVGHIERFNPAVLELGRLLLEGGWLSSVYSITSRRAGPFPARIRDVGVTIDLATHDVDILSWIAGERPVRVYAETAQRIHADHEDLLFGLMSFPSGTVGMLDVDWLTPAKRRQLDGRRRGGHVRARLPHPAADVHARHGYDQPAAHRRVCTDLRGSRRRAARPQRRAARRPSSARSSASSERADARWSTARTAAGRSSSHMPC